MYRVVLPAIMLVALAGCGMGSKTITSGLADIGQTASTSPKIKAGTALGGEPAKQRSARAKRQRQASLNTDAAPKRSFATTPKGSLATRDYRGARLDVEKARQLVNDYRRSKGLKALRIDAQLTNAAKAHSRDLARWDRISHYGSDGSNPWDRVKRSGYNAKLAAENVGTGQANIQEVFKGWQKSPGHNKNLLLADADHMGIALVHDTKTEFKTFWTLVIGAKL